MKPFALQKSPLPEADLIVLHARANNALVTALALVRTPEFTPAHARRAIKAVRRALPALGQIGGEKSNATTGRCKPSMDTGTDGKAGARYRRIKAGVLAGKIRPSVRGIRAAEGGSQDVVLGYLQKLENEGVTVRHGQGWSPVKEGGA